MSGPEQRGLQAAAPGSGCLSVRSHWSKDLPPDLPAESLSASSRLSVSSEASRDSPDPDPEWEQAAPPAWPGGSGPEGSGGSGPEGPGGAGPPPMADPGLQQLLQQHRLLLGGRCGRVGEGPGAPLTRVYTELHLTEGPGEEVQTRHEVWQLEAPRGPRDAPIRVQDIFAPPPGRPSPRLVLTVGVAGVGKTFSVLKFTLDWARGLENQDVSVVVLLSFRELNLLRDEPHSLLGLLAVFHPALKGLRAEQLAACRLLLIFDGLDESRLSLDFTSSPVLTDLTQRSPVSLLLTNLIRGDLLPSARLWITSHPAAANQIPPEYVDRLTEVRGFTDSKMEEYVRRRFRDQELSSRISSHIRSSRSLHTMCATPVFCWISAAVLEDMLTTQQRGELPTTMTELFSHFLMSQTKKKKLKYHEGQQTSPQELMEVDRELLLKLGRLAFEHLEKGSILFYQEDLEQCGLDVTEASVYSGVFTEIFKRECGIFQKPVYCFVHLSVQEFLAAAYLLHCHSRGDWGGLSGLLGDRQEDEEDDEDDKDDVDDDDDDEDEDEEDGRERRVTLEDFLNRVMEVSLQSPNGHLDLVVRFLHGLSVESNWSLLTSLLGPARSGPQTSLRVRRNLRQMQARSVSPDRSINIFHCLLEAGDVSVLQEISEFLRAPDRSRRLSEIQCSALAHMLQMSEEVLEELDLDQYNTSWEGRLRLVPAVRNCRRARLHECWLSETHFGVVVSALRSSPSHLRSLDLSGSRLQDSGLNLLMGGLQSPNCRLKALLLDDCGLTAVSCGRLAGALRGGPPPLELLDLSRNRLHDSGLQPLAATLQSPACRLQTLRLFDCGLLGGGCSHLAVALTSGPRLRELDLGYNRLQDGGVRDLAPGLGSPGSRLETLRLTCCQLSVGSCSALAVALTSAPPRLRELDLSLNPLQDGGVRELAPALRSPGCGLETLRMRDCSISFSGCALLVRGLSGSRIRSLDLSLNRLTRPEKIQLEALVEDQKLEVQL